MLVEQAFGLGQHERARMAQPRDLGGTLDQGEGSFGIAGVAIHASMQDAQQPPRPRHA